jgi:hypothetical protein
MQTSPSGFPHNEGGESATLGFAWEKDGKKYGITVAHLFEDGQGIGDNVFTKITRGDGTVEKVFIGRVVGFELRYTDSAIILINDDISIVPFALALWDDGTFDEAKLHHFHLPDPDEDPEYYKTEIGAEIVGFGAAGRGMTGFVEGIVTPENKSPVMDDSCLRGAINQSRINGEVLSSQGLTKVGDCGTLTVKTSNGAVTAMILGLHRSEEGIYSTIAVPLDRIIFRHRDFFFQSDEAIFRRQSATATNLVLNTTKTPHAKFHSKVNYSTGEYYRTRACQPIPNQKYI